MWIVWRPGCPDPSRPSAAIHHDDPAKDRDASGWLMPPIPIKPVHYGMTIDQLLTIDAYNLPREARASMDGDTTKAVGADPARLPVTIEA